MTTETDSGLNVIDVDDTFKVKCSDCRKTLMVLYEKEKAGIPLFHLVVDCPFCGDKSFQKAIYGIMRYLPGDGVQLANKIDEPNDIVRFKTGKVKK